MAERRQMADRLRDAWSSAARTSLRPGVIRRPITTTGSSRPSALSRSADRRAEQDERLAAEVEQDLDGRLVSRLGVTVLSSRS